MLSAPEVRSVPFFYYSACWRCSSFVTQVNCVPRSCSRLPPWTMGRCTWDGNILHTHTTQSWGRELKMFFRVTQKRSNQLNGMGRNYFAYFTAIFCTLKHFLLGMSMPAGVLGNSSLLLAVCVCVRVPVAAANNLCNVFIWPPSLTPLLSPIYPSIQHRASSSTRTRSHYPELQRAGAGPQQFTVRASMLRKNKAEM